MAGVFGRYVALNGEAVLLYVFLAAQSDVVRQRFALRDQHLAADDVVAGDLLGHGMFDLNTRVDFDEEELAAVSIDEKLHGPSIIGFTARPILMPRQGFSGAERHRDSERERSRQPSGAR